MNQIKLYKNSKTTILITKDNLVNNNIMKDEDIKKLIFNYLNNNTINYVEEINYLNGSSYLLVKSIFNNNLLLETPNNFKLQKTILNKYLFDRIKYTYSEDINEIVILISLDKTTYQVLDNKLVVKLNYNIIDKDLSLFELVYLKKLIENTFTKPIDFKPSITNYKNKLMQNGYIIEQDKKIVFKKELFNYIKPIIDDINIKEMNNKIKQLRMENI